MIIKCVEWDLVAARISVASEGLCQLSVERMELSVAHWSIEFKRPISADVTIQPMASSYKDSPLVIGSWLYRTFTLTLTYVISINRRIDQRYRHIGLLAICNFSGCVFVVDFGKCNKNLLWSTLKSKVMLLIIVESPTNGNLFLLLYNKILVYAAETLDWSRNRCDVFDRKYCFHA